MQMSVSDRRGSTSDRLKPAPVFKHPVTIHYEIQNHTTRMQKLTKAFKVYRLMALTLICVLAGIGIGVVCRPYAKHWTERNFMYIELPGELYLRFLKLMIIPLLVSNVILSFGTIQGKVSSRLGKVAGLLYLASNIIAITLAILTAVVMSPGGRSLARPALATQPSQAEASMAANGRSLPGDHDDESIHAYLHQYHESIARYREYHPMFYHTNARDFPHQQQAESLVHIALFSKAQGGVVASRWPAAGGGNPPTGADTTTTGQEDRAELPTMSYLASAPATSEPQVGAIFHTSGANATTTNALKADRRIEMEASTNPDGSQDTTHSVGSFHRPAAQADEPHELGHLGLSTKLPIDVVLDVLRNVIPDSLVGATLQQSRTRLFAPAEFKVDENGTIQPAPFTWLMGHELVQQPNIIGLLSMSVLTGVVLSHMGEASKPLLDLCSCVSELSLRIGMKAIHMAPLCIMFLLIGQISRARDLGSMAGELFMYVVTVLLALFIHGFIILPSIYYLVTKSSPLRFFKGLVQAMVASFATSSSSATMALMLSCLSELNLNLVIVRAFGPLGSVFNMNGTSIFEAVAVVFIAQMLGVRLPATSLLLIGLCSAIASLSTSGIPSSGMMTMVIVLNAINLPVLELSLIYIVDFIIDRFRTVVNVWSGAVVCGIIDHICPEELFEEEMGPEKYREMVKYRGSRVSLSSARKDSQVEEKPQVISVTITPPPNESTDI